MNPLSKPRIISCISLIVSYSILFHSILFYYFTPNYFMIYLLLELKIVGLTTDSNNAIIKAIHLLIDINAKLVP